MTAVNLAVASAMFLEAAFNIHSPPFQRDEQHRKLHKGPINTHFDELDAARQVN